MKLETETIDKLFLELSQFTRATTRKEMELNAIANKAIEDVHNLTKQLKALRDQLGRAEDILQQIEPAENQLLDSVNVTKWDEIITKYFEDVAKVVIEFPKND